MNLKNGKEKDLEDNQQNKSPNIRWMLVLYDLIVYAIIAFILLVIHGGTDKLTNTGVLQQAALSVVSIFMIRILGKVYGQIWRYGGVKCYIRLICTDSIAFLLYLCLELLLPVQKITFERMLSLACMNLLGAMTLRLMYHYTYKYANSNSFGGKCLSILLRLFSGMETENAKEIQKIKVAIIGA